MPVLQRSMVEQFHEEHVEATLTTNVPSRVPLRRTTTHLTLLTELLNANKDVRHGAAMVARLWQNVKILHFDGNHTLRFVFHSRRKAGFFVGAALRLQRVSLSWKTLATYALGRTTPPNSSGSTPCVSLVRPASGLRLSYTHSRGKTECKYSTLSGRGTVGRLWYWTLRFDTEDCSQMLRGVIHVREQTRSMCKPVDALSNDGHFATTRALRVRSSTIKFRQDNGTERFTLVDRNHDLPED
ncbi:hypothetical protein PC129_g12080 [Phytophthora cactorum]|uniref:Uncharacterized protein n=1 Tax=Phytophthora cactorum TaxID=29920 RepID=A0A329SRZ5_9STRA|nr:hypothetical protein PC113_g9547 [Phytophthora cactorum]KAG2909566.1 hypothetical protein PC114_g10087 [Phytophthora cactorum]KAG2924825.1 hypothetical protein PC115_g8483 [Phytophthora cactorum]KAG3217080.1 hypothetical protein PC129_g12080 [Phytophthora cactorum]KAG4239403.1 hypothetical protein PC116_g12587 [Phytophthora cactorum]